jgi:3-oxoacyl-[acyl-carrier protein] reductase
VSRLALVTGGSTGLGFAAAAALAGRGCDLVLVARNTDRLLAARERIHLLCPNVVIEAQVCDLEDMASVSQLTASRQTDGVPDIVVHVSGGPRLYVPGTEDEEELRRHIQSHSLSLWSMMKTFAPMMQQRGFGRFIAVMSRALAEPRADNPLSAAVRLPAWALMKSYSKSASFSRVTFNAVLPGLFETDRFRDVCVDLARQNGETVELARQRFLAAIPAGRVGRPEELGALCGLLASDEGGYINGQRITIDGGSSSSI